MILLMVAVAQATASPGVSVPSDINERLYASCAKVEAKRFEPSGEAAPVVADVAVSKCDSLLSLAYQEFISNFRNRPEIKTYEAAGRQYVNYEENRSDVLRKMQDTEHSIALDTVVEIRATRAVKK